MPHIRLHAFGPSLSVASLSVASLSVASLCLSVCIAAALLAFDAPAANAGKIKMVLPDEKEART